MRCPDRMPRTLLAKSLRRVAMDLLSPDKEGLPFNLPHVPAHSHGHIRSAPPKEPLGAQEVAAWSLCLYLLIMAPIILTGHTKHPDLMACPIPSLRPEDGLQIGLIHNPSLGSVDGSQLTIFLAPGKRVNANTLRSPYAPRNGISPNTPIASP